ncbi:DUF262 domain-containing protein [bacterium]|nr:DUF262 domain-containing protein [bacterium]
MEARAAQIRVLLEQVRCSVVPVFQRYYSWNEGNWQKLWDDITYVIKSEDPRKHHFVGPLVFVPSNASTLDVPQSRIIDGQQRLITISILLATIRDCIGKIRSTQNRNDIRLDEEIQETYLVNKHKDGEQYFKVWPRMRDRAAYKQVISGGAFDLDPELRRENRILEAYDFFIGKVTGGLLDKSDDMEWLKSLYLAVTARVDAVFIDLNELENPLRVFKSLNSTGVTLGDGDLIRNHLFMAIPDDTAQERFDTELWSHIESHFVETIKTEDGDTSYTSLSSGQLTAFIRNWMMSLEKQYVLDSAVYEEFDRKYTSMVPSEAMDVARQLKQYANFYDIAIGKCNHSSNEVQLALDHLQLLKHSTSIPLVLALLWFWTEKGKESDLIAKCISAIAGFVMRRHICGFSSRQYGHIFAKACYHIRERKPHKLFGFFKETGWPNDKELMSAFETMPLYRNSYKRIILESIERVMQNQTEPAISLKRCSIEHVLPVSVFTDQKGTGSVDINVRSWRESLGERFEEAMSLLHSPGNLTLVGSSYNSNMKNKPFSEKKPKLCAESKLTMNSYFRQDDLESWGPDEILKRSKLLATIVASTWMGPDVNGESS